MFTPKDISLCTSISQIAVKRRIGVYSSTESSASRKGIINKLPFFSNNKDFNK